MVRRSSFRLVAFLAVVALMAHGAPAQAQCSVTNAGGGTTAGNIYVYKTVAAATKCKLTGFNNVLECHPGGQPPTMTGATRLNGFVTATAAPMAINPYCKWKCYCPTGPTTAQVTISGSDGLPVELMDFAIEDDVAAAGRGEGGAGEAGRAGAVEARPAASR